MEFSPDQPYHVSPEVIDFYRKYRCIKLKNVFDAATLAHFGALISKKVAELNSNDIPLDARKTMILKQPENDNQFNDWNTWCPGAQVGKVIGTGLNPILFQK